MLLRQAPHASKPQPDWHAAAPKERPKERAQSSSSLLEGSSAKGAGVLGSLMVNVRAIGEGVKEGVMEDAQSVQQGMKDMMQNSRGGLVSQLAGGRTCDDAFRSAHAAAATAGDDLSERQARCRGRPSRREPALPQ